MRKENIIGSEHSALDEYQPDYVATDDLASDVWL